MCLSHLIYTVRPCLIHIYHAISMPCSDHIVLLKATAEHDRRETACGLPARVRLLPATTRSSTNVVIRGIPISDAGGQCETKQRLSWTRKRVVAAHYNNRRAVNPYPANVVNMVSSCNNASRRQMGFNSASEGLNCWTSSSDISGYRAYFHEGHGTDGAWQGRGMACVN
jgi:hypothetical protein